MQSEKRPVRRSLDTSQYQHLVKFGNSFNLWNTLTQNLRDHSLVHPVGCFASCIFWCWVVFARPTMVGRLGDKLGMFKEGYQFKCKKRKEKKREGFYSLQVIHSRHW